MKEEDLRKLGIFRIPIPIPFRQAGGPVNAYVIEEEDGGIMLWDVGIGGEQSQAALAQGLDRIGYGFKDVNRIVVSHGHVDHYGAAVWVQERMGRTIPVMIHSADAGKVLESSPDLVTMFERNNRYLMSLGIPLAVLEEIMGAVHRESGFGRRLAEVTPLLPGDIFRCKHTTLEVLHMPGHTPGLQAVAVRTGAGTAIIGSDCGHLFRNYEEDWPSTLIVDLAAWMKTYDKLKSKVASAKLLFPGHDPLMLKNYPKVADGVARLV